MYKVQFVVIVKLEGVGGGGVRDWFINVSRKLTVTISASHIITYNYRCDILLTYVVS